MRDAVKITQTSQNRSAGFPVLAAVGEKYLVVWTEDARPTKLRAALTGD
jgi:hypothetical protein